VAAYHKHVEKSVPVEDYDGRIDLYKLYGMMRYADITIHADCVQEIQHPRLCALFQQHGSSRTVGAIPGLFAFY